MSKADTPWGSEELIVNTSISMDGSGELVMKELDLDSSEMTPVVTHSQATAIIYVQEGAIDLQAGEDFYELEDGDTHVVQPGEKHQIENLDDSVSRVLTVMVPYDPDDRTVIDDPYQH